MSKNPVVTTMPVKLETSAQLTEFLLQKVLQLAYRTTIVWGFLAIFFPALGVTWVLVLAGLVALRSVRGVDNQVLINALVGRAK
jgi:hypothetical protein